jgi:hypothetical protein
MSSHNVEVNVTANTQQAQKSIGYLQSLMGEFGKQATNRFAAMLGAAAVAKMAFDKVSQAISANIATAKQVSQMAIKFNIDPSTMQSITMAAKDAGVSVRALTMSMKQLGKYAEKAISSKEIQVNFKQLGIEADKLNEIQAKPSKFLPQIAKSLMEIGDENQRSAAGAMLLGRQYQMLLPLIEELGTSEEAREKFLDNENAMTEDQIAAHKEVAKIQNDLQDGFERLVAGVAPLLTWAMSFVSLLADGLGFIKDMIFESDKAKKERKTKESSNFANRVERYASSLKAKQESGNLTEDEAKAIEKAGGVDQYITQQLEAVNEQKKKEKEAHLIYAQSEIGMYGEIVKEGDRRKYDAKQDEAKEAKKKQDKGFLVALGVDESLRGGFAYGSPDEQQGRYAQAHKELDTAAELGDIDKLAGPGRQAAARAIRGRADDAAAAKLKADMGKYVRVQKTKAAMLGLVYDEASDKMMGKEDYKALLEQRGVSEKDAEIKVRAFEEESSRVKREKAEKASVRKLAASERKLYVGDPKDKIYKEGLDEAEKAQDALTDSIEAQIEPLEELNEQKQLLADLERDLGEKEELGDEANILRLQQQVSTEQMKLNDLQVKANELKGQEIQASEALKRAKEKIFLEEVKRNEEVQNRIKAEEEHEKSLKYKIMKYEGKSTKEVDEERLNDQMLKYQEMLKEYKELYKKYMSPESGKGLKGEPISDEEKKDLEAKTKALEDQRRGILDLAFDSGSKDAQGQVTSMRRIGGGGMEFGGLAGTAKEQLNVARQSLETLRGMLGVMTNPAGYQFTQAKPGDKAPSGTTYAEVMPDR